MRVYSNSNRVAWRRWACRPGQIAKRLPLDRSHRLWLMFRTKAWMEASLSISRALLASSLIRLAHRTARSSTWRPFHRRHRLSSWSHSLLLTIISNSISSSTNTPVWWSKCRFLRNACLFSIRSARLLTQWTPWRFKKWNLSSAFVANSFAQLKVLPSFTSFNLYLKNCTHKSSSNESSALDAIRLLQIVS